MAEELFEGNIASEMTLGEAIVREILPEPKYVIAMYSYKNELKAYGYEPAGIHKEEKNDVKIIDTKTIKEKVIITDEKLMGQECQEVQEGQV